MYYATITPEEASRGRGSSAEEQLHEAVNALLYSYHSGSSVLIYEEALRELIGPSGILRSIHLCSPSSSSATLKPGGMWPKTGAIPIGAAGILLQLL